MSYRKAYRDQKRQEVRDYIKYYKENHPCVDCNKYYSACVMDFDHITTDKKINVSQIVKNRSIKDTIKEIAKCVIRCGNCHRLKTAKEHGMLNEIKDVNKKYYCFREIILSVKSQKCIDCNKYYNPYQMEFDHLPQFDKLCDIARISSKTKYSIDALLNEIDKCDVVCTNCHRIRTYIDRIEKPQIKIPEWLCICIKQYYALYYEKLTKNNPVAIKHSQSRTRNNHGSKEYRAWEYMKSICYNKNSKTYKNVGAKGIKVYDKWQKSFNNFYAYIGNCPLNMSLQRYDISKDYEPGNIYWGLKKSIRILSKAQRNISQ